MFRSIIDLKLVITYLGFVFDGKTLFDDVLATVQKKTKVMGVRAELKLQVGVFVLTILIEKIRVLNFRWLNFLEFHMEALSNHGSKSFLENRFTIYSFDCFQSNF